MRKYKALFATAFWITVCFAVVHYSFYLITETRFDWLMSAVPTLLFAYGCPVLVTWIAWREAKAERKAWHRGGWAVAIVFALIYLVLVTEATAKFVMGVMDGDRGFANYYVNYPCFLGMILVLTSVLWWLLKGNPKYEVKKKGWFGRIVCALPYVALFGTCVVFTVGCFSGGGSFPWWAVAVLATLCALPVLGGTLALRVIYSFVASKLEARMARKKG